MSVKLALVVALVFSMAGQCVSAQERNAAGLGGGLGGLIRAAKAGAAETAEPTKKAEAGGGLGQLSGGLSGSYKVEVNPASAVACATCQAGPVESVAVREIQTALQKPVQFEFADTPLTDVVDYAANHLDINIQLDGKGLTDAAVDPSAPVTFHVRKPVSAAAALRMILNEFDLTFVIQDEVLKITSKEKADVVLSTKVYYVGDLVATGSTNRMSRYSALMNTITSTVQPDTWEDNGGPGSIQPYLPTASLVFSQKQDVHTEVADLLEKLRLELKLHGADLQARQGELTPKAYPIGTASAEQMAEAIRKLVAPKTWQGQGGAGEICVVNRTAQPLGQQPNPPAGDVLLIRQTDDVHGEIADLLSGLHPHSGAAQGEGKAVGASASGRFGGGQFRVPEAR